MEPVELADPLEPAPAEPGMLPLVPAVFGVEPLGELVRPDVVPLEPVPP